MDKDQIILAAEAQFAREVTLGVIVTRPLKAWLYIIPGMFIVDFLRRTSAIRRYTKHFIFPRKLAVDAARALSQGEDKDTLNTHLRDDVAAWLNSLQLGSADLVQAHMELIDVLIAHYQKLLKAQGDTYYLLIENAYQTRENFAAFIEKITHVEHKVDQLVIQLYSENESVKEKMTAEQQQIEKRRQKILDDIF
jgi:hypothetical protein